MEFECAFSEQLIFLNETFDSNTQVLNFAVDALIKRGIVSEAYRHELLSREQQNPTGLALENYNIAIPHTDSSYIEKSQNVFISLKNPVNFQSMTDSKEKLEVKLVFLLVVENPKLQIQQLLSMSKIFNDSEKIESLVKCSSNEEFMKIIK